MKSIVKYIFISLLFCSCGNSNTKDVHSIQKGEYKASINESGELQAVYSKGITLPSIGYSYGWEFKIIDLAENGQEIKTGDIIAKFDQSSVKKAIIELQTQLELEQANLNKTIVSNKIEIRKLETALEEERANYDLKKLELEKFKFESKQKYKIKKMEFEQVEIQLAKAKERISLQQIIRKNELIIQKLKVKQIKDNIDNAYSAIDKLNVKSPSDGIVQIKQNRRTKLKYKIGDELYLGQAFALVPDLRKMKVRTKINELDYKKIKLGQKVLVRLDALPSVAFHGSVNFLGKLSKPKEKDSRIKAFDCEILIEESDPRLKPGMTVSSEIYYANYKEANFVSNNCVLTEEGISYVFTKESGNLQKHNITVEAVNNKFTLINSDLKSGQKLIPISKVKIES